MWKDRLAQFRKLGQSFNITDYGAGSAQTQSFAYAAGHRLIAAQASGGTGGSHGHRTYANSGNNGKVGNLTSRARVAYTYRDAASKHAASHLSGVQKHWYGANGNMATRKAGSDTCTQVSGLGQPAGAGCQALG